MQIVNWDKSYQNNQTPWREAKPDVDSLLGQSGITGGSALDLGCGTGEWGIALADKGFEVEGLDYSADALSIARSQSKKVTFVEWDLEKLSSYPFKHEKYNLIIDQKVLAFIQDKETYLNTIRQKLSGVFVLTVFHQHDEKPAICVPKTLFDRLIPSRFEVVHSELSTPRPGKIFATYWLKVDNQG